MQAIGKEICIGQRIREYRLQQKMTQQQLAEKIGLQQKDVCSWENGKRIPTLLNIGKITRAFGITMEEFFRGIDVGGEEEWD